MVQQRGRQVDSKTECRRRSAAGFSLLEVLIVVVVIGIIMAITVSALLHARDKARQGATIADMRNIATAIEAYTVDHSLPPDTQTFTNIAVLLRPYHNQHVPRLLHKLGFSVQRPRKRLARANSEAQDYWLRKRFPSIKKKPLPAEA